MSDRQSRTLTQSAEELRTLLRGIGRNMSRGTEMSEAAVAAAMQPRLTAPGQDDAGVSMRQTALTGRAEHISIRLDGDVIGEMVAERVDRELGKAARMGRYDR